MREIGVIARTFLLVLTGALAGGAVSVSPRQATGEPLGVEITAPPAVPLDGLKQRLAELGEPPLAEHEYKPAVAA